jgi:hypothetical protein
MPTTKLPIQLESLKPTIPDVVDDCNIATYLGLDSYLQKSVSQLKSEKEYFKLVKMMESNKNLNYLSKNVLDDIRYVQLRMETCVVSRLPKVMKLIYEIFLTFLLDTVCVRTTFDKPELKYMKNIWREEVQEKIENPYGSISLLENEYFKKYFEVGKRYIAKRNNFRVLFKKYVRVVGKLMVLYLSQKK